MQILTNKKIVLDKKAKKKTNDRINLNNKQPTIATIFPSV
jgi:hypothetical protein